MSEIVTVVTQNVLLDVARQKNGAILPQESRIVALADSLRRQFPNGIDVVGIQEAHQKTQHNGEMLAVLSGHEAGFWVNHNQKPSPESPMGRTGEHMGLFGGRVTTASEVELGDGRSGVMTEIAGVAFMTLHLRAGVTAEQRRARAEQAQKVISTLQDFDNAVVFGDFNEPHMGAPLNRLTRGRGLFAKNGFRSAYDVTGQPRPRTCPIPPYRPLFVSTTGWHDRLINRSWELDDILVRGPRIQVMAAGVLERARVVGPMREGVPAEVSDHDGLWARLAMDP